MSEDWKYLSDFKSWAADKYQEGLVLDKDILIQGNKLYSPETCVFVPQYVNTCVAKPNPKTTRGYKLGVNERKGRYISQISSDGNKLHLGVFTSEDAAHVAWQQAKISQLEVVVNRYATESWFNSKVAEAIMNRVWIIRLQVSKGEDTTFL